MRGLSVLALGALVSCAQPATPSPPPAVAPVDAAIVEAPADAGAKDAAVMMDASSEARDAGRPHASCGPAVEAAWSRTRFEGDPPTVFVKWLQAFADACAEVAPGLAKGARAAAVLDLDQRARALRDAAVPELDPRCSWASTEPMAEHPELPHCLTQWGRPNVASTQPYFGGKDPGILCDVNAGTYLFLVAAEPYLGEQAHVIEYALALSARETWARRRSCWAHRH